jgi:hypothetical protein
VTLKGKGFFIWKIKDCQGGNPDLIADEAYKAGFSHVLIKIADGAFAYNWDTVNNVDRIPPVVAALRKYGMQVWGWHYVYGYNPTGEARKAVAQVKKYNMDGYVIDAEGEFKQTGMDVAAKTFLTELRAGLPNLPVALCSFRWPSYHPQFPWKIFLEKCDLNMPMVYWIKAHNAGAQLKRSVQEFQAMTPIRPVIPVGPAFKESGWTPTIADQDDYFKTVKALSLPAVNYFSWDECRRDLPTLWDAIAKYQWTEYVAPSTPTVTANEYIKALNSDSKLSELSKLYDENAILVTAKATLKGWNELSVYFTDFLGQIKSGQFVMSGNKIENNSCNFTWSASSTLKNVKDGVDTIGLRNGKIAYHFSSYTLI